MNKILPRKGTHIWEEIFSPAIFRLDLVDGFKYRTKQTWFSLFVALSLFSLVGWLFFIDASSLNWSIFWLFLFYLPLLVVLLFWFRACSIYDCSVWKIHEEKKPITKKQTRASLIGKISLVVFGLYYCYWMYRLFMHR
jgi:hypothetical protein